MSIKRISWIDATKGLLILLMVMGHILSNAVKQGISTDYLSKCIFFTSVYTCFFMQAFIVLTGYTSNFEKAAKPFFVSLIKTVLIPWFSFSIISQVFRMMNGASLYYTFDNQRYFFLFEDFWFLHVLFFGKIIYYYIYKFIKRDIIRAGILLAMMLVGFVVFASHKDVETTYHYYNYLHYKDTLCMTFFLWFGNFCRRKNIFEYVRGKHLIVIISLYTLGHLVRFFFRTKGLDELLIAPVVISHGGNAVSPLQIPAYLYFVILGSLSCFGIMKLINRCRPLEYFGRNSLVIYCMHFIFLGFAVNTINLILLPVSIASAILFILCSLVIVLLSCMAIIVLTKYKPFNYLIGKF